MKLDFWPAKIKPGATPADEGLEDHIGPWSIAFSSKISWEFTPDLLHAFTYDRAGIGRGRGNQPTIVP
jgi:hypothetical protein